MSTTIVILSIIAIVLVGILGYVCGYYDGYVKAEDRTWAKANRKIGELEARIRSSVAPSDTRAENVSENGGNQMT